MKSNDYKSHKVKCIENVYTSVLNEELSLLDACIY